MNIDTPISSDSVDNPDEQLRQWAMSNGYAMSGGMEAQAAEHAEMELTAEEHFREELRAGVANALRVMFALAGGLVAMALASQKITQ